MLCKGVTSGIKIFNNLATFGFGATFGQYFALKFKFVLNSSIVEFNNLSKSGLWFKIRSSDAEI